MQSGDSSVARSPPVSGSISLTTKLEWLTAMDAAVGGEGDAGRACRRRRCGRRGGGTSSEPTSQKRTSFSSPVASQRLSGLKATWASSMSAGSRATTRGAAAAPPPAFASQIMTPAPCQVPVAIHLPSGLTASVVSRGWTPPTRAFSSAAGNADVRGVERGEQPAGGVDDEPPPVGRQADAAAAQAGALRRAEADDVRASPRCPASAAPTRRGWATAARRAGRW